jgi:hypothetical protein
MPAQRPSGPVKVIHGANDDDFDLVGVEVMVVYQDFAVAFNMPKQAISFVNGVRTGRDHRLQRSEIWEFILPWSRKGGDDQGNEYHHHF